MEVKSCTHVEISSLITSLTICLISWSFSLSLLARIRSRIASYGITTLSAAVGSFFGIYKLKIVPIVHININRTLILFAFMIATPLHHPLWPEREILKLLKLKSF